MIREKEPTPYKALKIEYRVLSEVLENFTSYSNHKAAIKIRKRMDEILAILENQWGEKHKSAETILKQTIEKVFLTSDIGSYHYTVTKTALDYIKRSL